MSSTRRDRFSLASETEASLISRRNDCATRDQKTRTRLERMGSEREAYQANVTRYDEFISDQTSSMARAIGRVGVMAADQERETAVEEIEGARVLTNGYFDSILKLRRDGADARTKVSRLTASIEETKGTLRATEREMTAIEQEIKHRGLPTAASCAPSASSSRR